MKKKIKNKKTKFSLKKVINNISFIFTIYIIININ